MPRRRRHQGLQANKSFGIASVITLVMSPDTAGTKTLFRLSLYF